MDIFISYTHRDNEILTDERGWVTDFHTVLERRLNQLVDFDIQIWRDKKLRGTDTLENELVENLNNVKLLLSVMSPRYLASEWCSTERKKFLEHYGNAEGIKRIVKVVKLPVDESKIPEELIPVLGLIFYELDAETGNAFEYNPWLEEYKGKFLKKINDLAHNLKDKLKLLQSSASIQSFKKVFLAIPDKSLADQRNILKYELTNRGFDVLPEEYILYSNNVQDDAIEKQLSLCELSIHLIDNIALNDAQSRLLVEKQLKIASRLNKKRLIWLKTPETPETSNFLTEHSSAEADIISCSFEGFKAIMLENLNHPDKSKAVHPLAGDLTYIYLIHQFQDKEFIKPIRKSLYDSGYEIKVPVFSGSVEEIRRNHEENLKNCHSFLIYYGSFKDNDRELNDNWLQSIVNDIKKAPGLGRTTPILSKAIYYEQGIAPYLTREALEINGSMPFRIDSLNEFLKTDKPSTN